MCIKNYLRKLEEVSLSEPTHFYKSMSQIWRTRVERDMDDQGHWTPEEPSIQTRLLSSVSVMRCLLMMNGVQKNSS